MKRIFTFLMLMLFLKVAIGQVAVKITVFDNQNYEPVAAATVTLAGASTPTAITDASGVALFSVPSPAEDQSFTYTVTAPGFLNYSNEWLYITTTDETVNSSAYLRKAFNIHFKVTDDSNVNIENAVVTVSSYPETTKSTDANGEVSFDAIYSSGYHSYTVTAEGYADSTAELVISNTDETTVEVPAVKLKKTYNIVFNVTNGTDPVQDASITVGDLTLKTDANGSATFPKNINGSYSYLITKSGYIDQTGTATVTDGNQPAAVVLSSGFDLTFNIINGLSGEVGLANDTITIQGITKISDQSGVLTFGVPAGTNVSFTNIKAGFKSVPVQVGNIQANTTLTINMVPVYNVAIHVLDGNTYNPISDVSVVFNGTEVMSDADGFAYFNNVEPSDVAYTYSVTGTGNYSSFSGEISLPFTSTENLIYYNNVVTINATLSNPGVFIALVDGWMSYFGGAKVFFDGIEYPYDTGLGAAMINCALGTHTYLVIPDDETKATFAGTVNVESNEMVYLPLAVVPGRNVEIYIVDASSDPVQGATVKFSGTMVTTDDTGLAAFNRLPAGSYTYSVTKEGFNSIEETALDIDVEDILKVITLTKGYTVTFNIKNKATAVAGVEVTCDGETVTTDETGTAVFSGKLAGTYLYSLNKSGYDVLSGTVTVTDANLIEDIDMVVTGVTGVSENQIKLFPNPTQGLIYVALPQDVQRTDVKVAVTNIAGSVVLANKLEILSHQLKLDISGFANGIYFVKISGKALDKTIKVVKN
jgi:hypothetical protein